MVFLICNLIFVGFISNFSEFLDLLLYIFFFFYLFRYFMFLIPLRGVPFSGILGVPLQEIPFVFLFSEILLRFCRVSHLYSNFFYFATFRFLFYRIFILFILVFYGILSFPVL